MSRRAALVCLAVIAYGPALAGQADDAALVEALLRALRPALPFPAATADGLPSDGRVDPEWTVRWPAPGERRVEVLANPLNPENRKRALQAEQEIQKAAMQAQRRSQGDYEKALSDFQRTGRTSEIREISLRDDGVAGERYDAESQLTVTVEWIGTEHAVSVATSKMPELVAGVKGPAAVVRVVANAYQESLLEGEPPLTRYCPEQAWVYVGAVAAPVVARTGAAGASIAVSPAGGASPAGRGAAVVWIGGNAALVDQVLKQANWLALGTLVGG